MKQPIINCHTHIFTGDSVPPYLAKTFLPWPLYYLLPISLVVRLFRFWYRGPYTWQFKPWYRSLKTVLYRIKMKAKRNGFLGFLSFLLGSLLTIHVFFILVDWFSEIKAPGDSVNGPLLQARDWLTDHRLLFIPASVLGKLVLIFLLIIFFKSGRNVIWFALKKIWSFLDVLPGPKAKDLARRYINIGRFSFYKQQSRIFGRLRDQYPAGTGFVVLPMDMEYMEAGELKTGHCYNEQMEALAVMKKKDEYKNILYPFVFAEPRRMREEGAAHFEYRIDKGSVILEDCFIKRYIEDHKFSGFKIYPALGYYAFDETLLPLWKYAADHGLPILTHCIRGAIFYRGKKQKAWDHHPIFEHACGNDVYEPMLMMEMANADFINNFTHPLNYLCLLEESLLRKIVSKAADPRIRELFGYTDEHTPLLRNLAHLKLCFGHFGGDDEWDRFIEFDRDNYAGELVKDPASGISFLTHEDGKQSRGKLEQLWKFADWYSIICSMMLQYPNVYADLSYIIHSPAIQPLLKQTLMNLKFRERTLFGTDFYVVRNHKSEKNMLADVLAYLTEEELDQIARINPRAFLFNKLHGPVPI